ncbi:uncharacterized protein LOC108735921 [Agrilus planipennis]|uniref:Uncharacterized protein LOC108735921 n=1 Tax=Agrilus planipennis TaxID=224129 RepID=A0A1W4WUD7_AGRPL|nr:uncharacterized protein LOC108735921 [Agrilus planipennis]XP_018323656.1 uncharacterized protein LOC108735921 [Agrilus planipennis]
MMMTNTPEEELQLEAMQRVWQRKPSSLSVFEESVELDDIFTSASQVGPSLIASCASPATKPTPIHEEEVFECEPDLEELVDTGLQPVKLSASDLGDFPAQYIVYGLLPHQLPVVGVFVDNRVVPGFKYKVSPLPSKEQVRRCLPYLFNGKALTLKSIGRGYARRFTFEADKGCLNNNENYFWSDNRPEGFAFEMEIVSEGDKFTIYDVMQEAQGTLEVLKIEGPQIEISTEYTKNGIEKRAKVNFIGKVEFYETGVAKPKPVSGTVICIKQKGKSNAEIRKIVNVKINSHRYILKPGIYKTDRRVVVKGEDINDIPTRYTINGLEHYELPVVGTYVDPRVIPGFCYKVRPNDRKERLFEGRSLRLLSIGMGYAKRLTFAPDSLLEPNNYLWSDNHPDGLGLEPRALEKGMKFTILAGDQNIGTATVWRADLPQKEEKMERVPSSCGKQCAIEKYIHVDVLCHVRMNITGSNGEEHLLRVYGLAVVRKEPNSNKASVVRVESVGIDSQINVLFVQTHTELIFKP